MSFISRAIGGLAAGLGATVIMSLAFAAAKKAHALPTLPPMIIVRDISPQLRDDSAPSVAAIAHVSYGALAGAAFSVLVPRGWGNPITGALFGIGVWAVGYEGWLPFLGILPPAHKDARPRAVSILLAHVIYGASLGRLSARGSAGWH